MSDKKYSNEECATKDSNTKKGGNQSASKARQSHKRRNGSSKPRQLEVAKRDNNPNWYFIDSTIAEQVCNYSFETVLGVGNKPVVPTVATLYFNPSIGTSYNLSEGDYSSEGDNMPDHAPLFGNDGANYAAMKLYTQLSASSGRNAQYQPNDVLIAVLAMSSVLEYAETLRRAFGVAYTYNPRNRVVPELLIKSMNIDFSDFVSNIADYRTRFNYILSRINELPIPSNIAYLQKAIEMYQRIYADADSSLSQLYMYMPATVWELDEINWEQGSVLRTIPVGVSMEGGLTPANRVRYTLHSDSALTTMPEHLDQLESMITKLLNSTTLNLVYMDLIHLAEKKNFGFLHLDYLADGYAVVPEVNTNSLLQFHNSNIFTGNPFNTTVDGWSVMKEVECGDGNKIKVTPINDVFSDVNSGRLIYNPAVQASNRYTDIIVDFPNPNPSLEDKIEASRFTSVISNYSFLDNAVRFSTLNCLPDHFIIGIGVQYDVYTPYFLTPTNYLQYKGTGASVTVGEFNGAISMYTALNKFTAAPIWPVLTADYNLQTVMGDLNYWTTIDFTKAARMNQVMLAGLFDFRLK